MKDKEPNVYSFFDECYVYYGDYKKLEQFYKTDIENANEIIAELQARIDKAIAYIESEKAIKCSGIPLKNFEIYENTLLDILNGSDKE